MMSRVKQALLNKVRNGRGFTLTEMLVTMLILVLASTLLATGVPVAIDTYRKTVNSANAQIALSTTATVLRSELGLSTDVVVPTGSGKVYFTDADGTWVSIENNSDTVNHRGLEKQYYKGANTSASSDEVSGLTEDGGPYQLISDASVPSTSELNKLTVSFESVARTADRVTFTSLKVTDTEGNTLARIASYEVLTRFAN